VKITRIESRPAADRVRLYLDGDDAPAAEIAVDLLLREGLAAGDEVSDGRLAELRRADDTYRGREAAIALLAHRPRARAELQRRLRRKEFDDVVIEDVLAWLDERGYVDDRAFAEAFVRDRLRLKPSGRLRLLQELGRKGVDPTTAEAAVDAVMGEESVTDVRLARDAADAWARKNRRALRRAAGSKEDRLKARRRLYGHLARRGFTGDAVRTAIAAILDD
jgi:regulatory protein